MGDFTLNLWMGLLVAALSIVGFAVIDHYAQKRQRKP